MSVPTEGTVSSQGDGSARQPADPARPSLNEPAQGYSPAKLNGQPITRSENVGDADRSLSGMAGNWKRRSQVKGEHQASPDLFRQLRHRQ